MKKLLLSLTALVMLSACSDDDTASTNNNGLQLKKMNQISYYNGAVESTGVFEFVDGKPSKNLYYSESGALTFYDTFTYENGLLKTIKGYMPNNVLEHQSVITYDAQGRISRYTNEEISNEYSGAVSYVFNANNTITATSVSGTNTQTKTYYLNSDNLIYKEVSQNNTYELTYNGYNPVRSQSTYGSKTFEYLDTPTPPANYNIWGNILGSYKANAVLRDNSLQDFELANVTKYIKKEVQEGEVIEYEYTFNDAQLPVKIKRYRNTVLEDETEYTYE